MSDKFIDTLPAQMWTGQDWYQGTADAIFQNLHLVESQDPDQVAIFGGDHIYTMDVRKMIDLHESTGAALTVAAIPVPVEDSYHFGIIEVDENGAYDRF